MTITPGLPPLPEPASDRAPLRIALHLTRRTDPVFLARALDALERCPVADLVLVIRGSDSESRAPSPLTPQGPDGKGLLPKLHRWLDVGRNGALLEQAHRDIGTLLDTVPSILLHEDQAERDASEQEIEALALDLILEVGPGQGSELSRLSRYGAWSLTALNHNRTARRSLAMERLTDDGDVSRVGVLFHTNGHDNAVPAATTAISRPATLSSVVLAGVEGAAAAEVLAWYLWRLHAYGLPGVAETDGERRPDGAKEPGQARRSGASRTLGAGAAAMARGIRSRFGHFASRRLPPTRVREWQIGLRPASGRMPWEGGWDDFRWIEAPTGHYLADPFLLDRDGSTWLFAEDFVYRENKGRIVCARIDAGGSAGAWITVLDRPCHLSFPCVFEHGGETWLIPESRDAGSVDLYRAERFPDRWVKVQTLWQGPGLDTVPHRSDDGCWYFFTSVQTQRALAPQLLLFTATDLTAPWSLHPASPLCQDIRTARNAGRILKLKDRAGKTGLYRVCQDGSGRYGRRLRFSEIRVLTRERYVERPAAAWTPPAGLTGAHHYELGSTWETVDAARTRPLQRPGARSAGSSPWW